MWLSRGLIVVGLLVGAVAVPSVPVSAAGLDLVASVTFDGTAGFDGDDAPGSDSAPDNLRVRSNDTIGYRVDWNSSDSDATGHAVTLSLNGGAMFEVVPDGCLAGSSLAVDRLSLTCVTGDHSEGTAGVIFAEALALGTVLDGTVVSMTASAVDDQGGTASALVDVVVTSTPGVNMRKNLVAKAQSFVVGNVVDSGGVSGDVVVWSVSFGPEMVSGAPLKGAGPIHTDFSFVDDITATTPNTRLVDFPVARLGPSGACGPWSLDTAVGTGPPYGTVGITGEATAENSTVDSGVWTCTPQAGNAQLIDIDVVGADTTPSTIPAQNPYGRSLAPEQYLLSGQVATFTPHSDIPSGTLVTNTVTGFDPAGAGGIGSNYGTGVEPTVDNQRTRLIGATTSGPHFPGPGLTLYRPDTGYKVSENQIVLDVDGNAIPSPDNLHLGFRGNDWNPYPSGATVGTARPGDALLLPGDELLAQADVHSFVTLQQSSFDVGVVSCVTFDPSLVRLRDNTNPFPVRRVSWDRPNLFATVGYEQPIAPGPHGLSVRDSMRLDSEGPQSSYVAVFDDSSLVIEFGDGGWVGIDEQRFSTCDEAVNWATDPSVLPGGIDSVSRIKIRTTSPLAYPAGYSGPTDTILTSRDLDAWVPLVVAPGAPVGQEVHVTTRGGRFNNATPNTVSWSTPNYNIANHNSGQGGGGGISGDQFVVADSVLTVAKSSPLEGQAVPAGATVPWQIDVTVAGQATGVTVDDVLPAELSYVSGSANVAPTTTSPLSWDLGDVSDSVTTITFDTVVDLGAVIGSSLTNRSDVVSNLGETYDIASVAVRGGASRFLITKAVSGSVIEPDTAFSFDLTYINVGETVLGGVDMIDVLPFVGDDGALVNRIDGSVFSGTVELTSVVPSDVPERFLVTSADPATVSMDPQEPSNMSGGATVWCELVDTGATPDIGDPECPASLLEATALRFEQAAALGIGEQHTVGFTVTPSGNTGDDLYVNNFGGLVEGIQIPAVSNDVAITVIAASVGDVVWEDTNRDGIQDTAEPGIEGVTVELLDEGRMVIASTVTASDGAYLFDSLISGVYRVRVVVPDGFDVSPQNVGADLTVDSDIDLVTGETGDVALIAPERNPTVDAGLIRLVYDLVLTKTTDTTGPVADGDQVTYTITVTNQGELVADSLAVVDDLPDGTTFVSASGGGVDNGDGSVTWTLADQQLEPDTSISLTVTVDVTECSSTGYTNTAEIIQDDGDDIDSTPANNIADEDDQDSVTLQGPETCTTTTTTTTATTTVAATTTMATPATVTLPPTGANTSPAISAALVIFSIGAALVAITRRRKNTQVRCLDAPTV